MCRILSYLGKPTLLKNLLYNPDNSFIKQSYQPQHMYYLLNLAGFGIAAWEKNSHDNLLPFLYRTPQLPFYDENLHNLALKITPSCILAHLRGVIYSPNQVISNQNVHPFLFSNTNVALAHNGELNNFEYMRYDLLEYVLPMYRPHIHGTTDSEWIYAIFISQLTTIANNETQYTNQMISKAIKKTLIILQEIRYKNNIQISSAVNLFITNGKFIAATRYVLDYGWHNEIPEKFIYNSLWYTYGDSYGLYNNEYRMKEGPISSSIIIASEPLTEDTSTWLQVPEYTLMIAHLTNNRNKEKISLYFEDLH